jgi:hypothetical protein
MSEPKPFASLSSGLLARKGAAKPAMRPQGFGNFGAGIEDLGWNDMGHAPTPANLYEPDEADVPDHVPSSIAALTPSPALRPVDAPEEEAGEPPLVEQQRAAIAASFATSADETADSAQRTLVAVLPLPPRPRQQAGSKPKAAFTLRLDADRHLRLRLACAVSHRSAQQIVTEALDTFLKSLPELEALAEKVPASASGRS